MSEVTTGRPTVITPATVRKLEQAFKDGLSVSEACFVSGIGRTAYYERRSNDEAFANKMELAKAYVSIKAKKTVVQAIDTGNLTAAKWWLERKARNEFGTNTVDEDAQWETQHTANQSDDVLRQILDSMGAIADKAIEEANTPHKALKVIATELNSLQPDDALATELQVAPEVVQAVVAPVATSNDDILADLYYDD
jgi:hypothetical protein